VIVLLSVPTNLGLQPPGPGSVPGAAQGPEALREAGLLRRLAELGARDGGVVLPGRSVDDDADRPAGRVRDEAALVEHARRLADRVTGVLRDGHAPLVVGGDCSVFLGAGVAMAHRGVAGLVHVDGHTDFRHPGDSDRCASVAAEDLDPDGRHARLVTDVVVDGHAGLGSALGRPAPGERAGSAPDFGRRLRAIAGERVPAMQARAEDHEERGPGDPAGGMGRIGGSAIVSAHSSTRRTSRCAGGGRPGGVDGVGRAGSPHPTARERSQRLGMPPSRSTRG